MRRLLNLRNKKIIIAGIHGTGKTFLAQFISRRFKTIVYSPYFEEWKNEDVAYIQTHDFINEFPSWCSKVMALAQRNKVDLFVVDDADIMFRTHFDVSPQFRELHVKHRHLGKGLAIAYVTRRIQDIPTRIYGTCEFLALFSQESPQATELLNRFQEGLGDRVKAIPYGSYQFILKEIGKEPILMKV